MEPRTCGSRIEQAFRGYAFSRIKPGAPGQPACFHRLADLHRARRCTKRGGGGNSSCSGGSNSPTPYNFTVTAVDHWGFTGTTNYGLTVGTTTPPGLTDQFYPTVAVSSDNRLLVTGHLHDLYSGTVYSSIGAYYSQNGGAETYLSTKNVNVETNSVSGTPVDMGQMVLTSGNFNVRLTNSGVTPTNMDGTAFSYVASVPVSGLSTTYTTPGASVQFTLSVVLKSDGHIWVTGHLPRTFTSSLTANVWVYYSQGNSAESFLKSDNVVIPAGATDGTEKDYGYVSVSPGVFVVRLSNQGLTPTSLNGINISYNTSSTLS
jgi:hypothetical protein